ncbi:hypothetical protein FNF28_07058 [Cafeteria roenbergensis]|uniref:Ribosome biogenesis protein NOP53 n=1 Tax=Cafeteria roenbergensis TaxID=33653 RepID=A0A5A8CJF6_CAFRO|nr:hypothetical protein FNF28_07058 [Cafeteria roenbergensis]
MEAEAVVAAAAAAWVRHAKGRRTVAFCVTVHQAALLAAALRERGVAAAVVEASTKEADRDAAFDALRTGETRVLCSVGVLSEGFDEPAVGCVLLLRPTQSKSLYVQQVGRGLRRCEAVEDEEAEPGAATAAAAGAGGPSEGPAAGDAAATGAGGTAASWVARRGVTRKRQCLVLDLAGNALRHGIKAVASEVDAFTEDAAQASRLERMTDEALFSLDTSGMSKGGAKRPGKRPRSGADNDGAERSKVRLFTLPEAPAHAETATHRVQTRKVSKRAAKRAQRLKAEAEAAERERHASRKTDGSASFLTSMEAAEPAADLWAEDTTAKAPVIARGEDAPKGSFAFSHEYLRGAAVPSEPELARRQPRTVPKGRKVSAVAVPAGGLSYNPSFEDHQDAVGEAVARERAFVARRERLAALWEDDPDYSRTLDVIPDFSDDEDEDEGSSRAAPGGVPQSLSANPPVVNRRKTTVQRNKEKRLAAEAAVRARDAKAAELDRIAAAHRSLARKAREELEAKRQRREERLSAKAARDAAAEPKLLLKGKDARERGDVEVQLTSDLRGSLRQIKPSTARHPVQERWRGLMLQDKVEVGARRQGKQRTKKKVVATGERPGGPSRRERR